MTEFHAPRPIATGDVLSGFSCGEDALDRWLRGFARRNERSGASRTMVSVTEEQRVAGYSCLSASAVVRAEGPDALVQGQPDPVPVVLLGRLAVDRAFAGVGLGASLLQHAVVQAISAADIVGMRAVLVHALREDVVPFYERFGFVRFGPGRTTLFLLAADARATLLAR